jgi:ubiquinone/menaquinone biosynthesis C-methylase UbiE
LLRRGPGANPAVSLAQAHGERLPFAAASFEAVFAECTLSLFDIETALPEWARVLQPGGYLLVNDLFIGSPAGAAALRQLPPGSCLQAALPRAQILENIAACDLELLAWEEYPQALRQFPACTLSTAAEIDPFDLIIAATRAKLGYYLLAARKVLYG